MHPDPADRIIVSTAPYLGASVIARDETIADCGIVPCVGSVTGVPYDP